MQVPSRRLRYVTVEFTGFEMRHIESATRQSVSVMEVVFHVAAGIWLFW